VLGYLFGNQVSSSITGQRGCPTPAGVIGACVTGGISAALGGLPTFERVFWNGALGLASNFYSQLSTGAIQNRRGDAVSYVVSGVVGAAAGVTPASGLAQGAIASGLGGAASPVIEALLRAFFESIHFRAAGLIS